MRRTYSIEGLIVASTALVFLIVGSLLVLTIRSNATTAADEAFDRVLEAAALSIADTVAYVDGEVTVDIPYSAFAILGTSRLNRIFYRVAAPGGEIVTGDPVLGLEMSSANGPEIRFLDSMMQDEPIRLAAVSRYRSDATTGEAGWIDVYVGETREARSLLTSQLTTNALLPAIAIAICAFGIIWVGIRLAFSPLRSIERVLSQRTPANLDPINEYLPREVAALVRTLNEFMERLSSTLDGLRRVTAEAAHQFRTPLAAMRAQAELALEEDDPNAIRRRLQRIHANAVTTSTLAARLLADATLLHSIKSGETERVDLVAVTRHVIEQALADTQSDQAECRPAFTHPDIPVWIDADPVSLGEAIRNVVDNAFIYGGGPTAITLTCSKNKTILKIRDRGPGIPADRRDIVFERFERNTVLPGGTGLGLAISRDVVTGLGGAITLEAPSDGGLCVVISLPRKTGAASTRPGAHRNAWTAVMITAALLFSGAITTGTARAQSTFTVTAPFAPDRFQPVLDALEARYAELDFVYQQARSTQVAARISARAPLEADLVIMAAPDIAVQITNQGHVARIGLPSRLMKSGSGSSWRGELFTLAYDPALILVSRDWAEGGSGRIPSSRLELAQALETSPDLFKRIGIVNVGIDAVSYTLAAQDSLRSPLYWRLAAAFGSAQAQIFDTGAELVDALRRGDLDVAYNVPLSEAGIAGPPAAYQIVVPQDYTLGLPWTMFVPASSNSSYGAHVVSFLLSPEGQKVVSDAIWHENVQQYLEVKEQRIHLGPELLVYLDSIKRSNFLDAWFELVTSP